MNNFCCVKWAQKQLTDKKQKKQKKNKKKIKMYVDEEAKDEENENPFVNV